MVKTNQVSGVAEGFSKPRRKRVTRTVIHWVNAKHCPIIPRQSIDARIKSLYQELGMGKVEILNHKLSLCKG